MEEKSIENLQAEAEQTDEKTQSDNSEVPAEKSISAAASEIAAATEESAEDKAAAQTDDYSIYRKLLVFSVAERKFSVESACVDEIVNDTEVYSLPFVPECVEGVINLRGQPVTVFNPFLFEKDSNEAKSDFKGIKKQTHCNILKLKCSDEAFGIKISSVETFIPENKAEGIVELKVDKMETDLRNTLGYEND